MLILAPPENLVRTLTSDEVNVAHGGSPCQNVARLAEVEPVEPKRGEEGNISDRVKDGVGEEREVSVVRWSGEMKAAKFVEEAGDGGEGKADESVGVGNVVED